MSKAIIAAAGWKGAGYRDGLPGCPEPFLPLGDGTTVLSRTATILAENSFDVYIAMGKRGYPYKKYVRWVSANQPPEFNPDFPWDGTPWTQSRFDYASQLGTVIEVPNPGGWTSHLDTFCEAMDTLGSDNWDNLLLLPGDMVIPRECLEYMLTLERPFTLSFTAFHTYFFMDKPDSRFFRACAEPFRRFANEESWKSDKNMAPNHWGGRTLALCGFDIHPHDILPEHEWTDIDTLPTYHDAKRLISEQ